MSKYEEKPVVMLHDEDDGRDFLFEREVPADAMFPAGAEARIDIPLKRKMEHDRSDMKRFKVATSPSKTPPWVKSLKSTLNNNSRESQLLCDKLSGLTSSIDKLAVQVEILNQKKDGQEQSVATLVTATQSLVRLTQNFTKPVSQTGRDGQESETSSRRQEEAAKQTEGRDARERIKEKRSAPERRRGDTVSPDRGRIDQLKDATSRKKRLSRWRY